MAGPFPHVGFSTLCGSAPESPCHNGCSAFCTPVTTMGTIAPGPFHLLDTYKPKHLDFVHNVDEKVLMWLKENEKAEHMFIRFGGREMNQRCDSGYWFPTPLLLGFL
ncbi:inner centromere protein isoform X1 [Sigmodon hispidus]